MNNKQDAGLYIKIPKTHHQRGKDGKLPMAEKTFMTVEEVAEELRISKSYAYKIVRQLNEELKSKGYLTICGKVNRRFFQEKTCYGEIERRDT